MKTLFENGNAYLLKSTGAAWPFKLQPESLHQSDDSRVEGLERRSQTADDVPIIPAPGNP